MNKLDHESQCRVIAALVEGNSIRSVERMTGVHRDTIARLMVRVGEGCDRLMDEMMHGLTCERLQLDEIWAYVGMEQKTAKRLQKGDEFCDVYTFVAVDAQTTLMPCFHVGKRRWNDTVEFIEDLRSRVTNRPQITTDAFQPYYDAIMRAFGNRCDYAQLIKIFQETAIEPGRYSPAACVGTKHEELIGNPDPAHISTSFVERQNLTMRMQMRRFTRLTNGFSKRRVNHAAAVSLRFAHYNLVRMHKTLRMTPALAHGVSDHIWTVKELIEKAASN